MLVVLFYMYVWTNTTLSKPKENSKTIQPPQNQKQNLRHSQSEHEEILLQISRSLVPCHHLLVIVVIHHFLPSIFISSTTQERASLSSAMSD
mmetsp:Transcript_33016/g.79834  ORF Transcript_33016/g.79834 Transcript_33016/m.79834 type:complete len:92 (+) Transcript_33016:92-367(+)